MPGEAIDDRGPTNADLGLASAVRNGLPVSALDRLISDGVVAEREIEARFIPRRTLYARRHKGVLSRDANARGINVATGVPTTGPRCRTIRRSLASAGARSPLDTFDHRWWPPLQANGPVHDEPHSLAKGQPCRCDLPPQPILRTPRHPRRPASRRGVPVIPIPALSDQIGAAG
jgi:hypothetical protein